LAESETRAQHSKKLAKLDCVHAWAVITAVEWYKDNQERVSPSDPCWTLEFKRRPVDGELMKPAKRVAHA
jgi:hypothetical protein